MESIKPYLYPDGVQGYRCTVCQFLCLRTMNEVTKHLEGKRHRKALRKVHVGSLKPVCCPILTHCVGDSHGGKYLFRNMVGTKSHFVTGSMYSFATGRRDVDFHALGVRPGQAVVLSYGEIDVRMHIGRLRDIGNATTTTTKTEERCVEGDNTTSNQDKQPWESEEESCNRDSVLSKDDEVPDNEESGSSASCVVKNIELIRPLVSSYLEKVVASRQKFENQTVVFVILSTPPPSDRLPNPKAPFYGSLSDRIQITQELNMCLAEACAAHDVLFLDGFVPFTTEDGSLDHDFSDGHVHVRTECARSLQEMLVQMLHREVGRMKSRGVAIIPSVPLSDSIASREGIVAAEVEKSFDVSGGNAASTSNAATSATDTVVAASQHKEVVEGSSEAVSPRVGDAPDRRSLKRKAAVSSPRMQGTGNSNIGSSEADRGDAKHRRVV